MRRERATSICAAACRARSDAQLIFELADLHRALRVLSPAAVNKRIGVAPIERVAFVGENLLQQRELIDQCFEGLPQRARHESILWAFLEIVLEFEEFLREAHRVDVVAAFGDRLADVV